MAVDCSDLDQLAEDARCWVAKFDQQQLQAVIAYLTCQAANAGGGGGVTSIIAGTGISVDQPTGDVTVTATGGGGGTDIYWFDGSSSAPISVDVLALGAGNHDITGSMPGWTGAETAALLAAIQAGKKISFSMSAEAQYQNSGVVGFNGNIGVQFGGSDDGVNYPPFTALIATVSVLAQSFASCPANIEYTADFQEIVGIIVGGLAATRPNADGTCNDLVISAAGPIQGDGSYSGIFDGKIYVNLSQTNCSSAVISITQFRITVLN